MIIRHILFPTDFSERDTLTEAYVRRFATNFNTHVTVLHVIDESEPYQCGGGFDERTCVRELHEKANARLAEVLPGLAADRVVLFGDIGTAIADCAEESGADLIMIPLHARAPLARLFRDSVAAGILDDTRWRVWSTSHISEAPGQEHIALKRIACIVSPGPSSRTIGRAEELARSFQATLSLGCAVVDTPGPSRRTLGWFALSNRKSESGPRQIGSVVNGIRWECGARFELHVAESGPPSAAIATIAQRAHADLIVVDRAEAERLSSPLNSALYSIVRDAPCPVMVL